MRISFVQKTVSAKLLIDCLKQTTEIVALTFMPLLIENALKIEIVLIRVQLFHYIRI